MPGTRGASSAGRASDGARCTRSMARRTARPMINMARTIPHTVKKTAPCRTAEPLRSRSGVETNSSGVATVVTQA